MTPDEAIAEYHRTIAEYDRLHAPCPIEQRPRRREAERQERQSREVRKIENEANTLANLDAWFEDRFNAAHAEPGGLLVTSVGQVLGETSARLRRQFEAKLAVLETRLKDLKQRQALDQKFFELERA